MKCTGSNDSQPSGMSRRGSTLCASRQSDSAAPGWAYRRPVTHCSHARPVAGSAMRSVYCSTQRVEDYRMRNRKGM